jgi:protein-S-isoprenylcysteine O-methyltransferase Ste14
MRTANRIDLEQLVGSGDRIGLFVLPFAAVGVVLNVVFPSLFEVGGPPRWLRTLSIVVLTVGVAVWAWCVGLLLTRVPRGELVTNGPYAVVKHPLYTDVALLVLPWLGFLLNTWLGAALGLALYVGARRFAPEEEAQLTDRFGSVWEEYRRSVWIPWL